MILFVVVVVVVESGEPGELDESGLKKENRLLEEKINDDADRPTKRIQSNLPFQKLENRKKTEICNLVMEKYTGTLFPLVYKLLHLKAIFLLFLHI